MMCHSLINTKLHLLANPWNKRTKTLQDMLLMENNPLWAGYTTLSETMYYNRMPQVFHSLHNVYLFCFFAEYYGWCQFTA